MPLFRYITRDAVGLAQAGTLLAPSLEALTSELRGRGLLVIEAEPVVDAEQSGFSLNPATWLPMTTFDVGLGFQQLATMLRSGLSLLAGLRIVAEQSRRPRAARIWRDLAVRIEQGSTFSGALAAHASVFSEHVVQLIRVGEHAGTLDTSLTRSAEHLERSRAIRLLVLNALAYPLLVVILTIGVAAFMVVSVIPKVQKFLGGSGRKLPEITQLLIDISSFITAYLPYLAIGLVATVVAVILSRQWPPGRRFFDAVLLRTPVVGYILRLSATAVFARAMGSLLESGVTLLDGLTTMERLVGNTVIRERIAAARESVLRGGTLAASLLQTRDFLPMLGRMVSVGETAGTLASILGEVATFHEAQLVATIRRLSAVIEPVLILAVGGVVGFVYMAFFISIFSLAGGVR